MLDQPGFDHAIDFLDVALMQRRKDRALVREVLVHRTDANPGHLSNAIGSDGIKALALQHSHDCVQHRIDGLKRAPLLRLATS